MAFDGNGNWISNFSAVADRDANIKILASRFDDIFIADIAQSFENCLTKDAQVKPQQAFDANSYKVINVANPTNPYDAVNLQTLTSIWPVGSIYIGTQNTCPLETLIAGSTWELVATDKALWGADGSNANTIINAGLPDHNHTYTNVARHGYNGIAATQAFFANGDSSQGNVTLTTTNASSSNPIYGNSTTVQPPAYRVNVWRRTA